MADERLRALERALADDRSEENEVALFAELVRRGLWRRPDPSREWSSALPCAVPWCDVLDTGSDWDGAPFTYCSRHNDMMHLRADIELPH